MSKLKGEILIAMQMNLGLGHCGEILITTQERVDGNQEPIAKDIIDKDYAEEIIRRWNAFEKQQPPAGEFTKKNRRYFTLLPEEECDTLIQKAVRHCSLVIQEACDRLDRAEASKAELLEASERGLSYINAIVCKVPRPITELQEDKKFVEAAIAKAKKEG